MRRVRLGVFANRNFTLLWSAQFISIAGTSLSTLAGGVVVYRVTGSALSVGLMMIATVLPSLCVGALAGVFVDRGDRRHFMLASDLLRAALVLSIPFAIDLSIAWLFGIIALINAVGQFFNPANASLLQETVRDDELPAANAFSAISSLGAPALGFAAAGLIAAGLPIAWAFYIDCLSYLLSAACTWQLRGLVTRGSNHADHTMLADVLSDLRTGAGFVTRSHLLRSLFLIYLPVFIGIGLFNTVLLPLSRQALHATDSVFGLLTAADSFGLICSSLLMVRGIGRLPAGVWVAVSFVGMGVSGMAISMMPSAMLAAACCFIFGVTNAPSVVARQLILQRSTPRDLRGRVHSAFFVSRDLMYVLGMAAVGLADVMDVRLLLGIGCAAIAACGLVALRLPGLGRPDIRGPVVRPASARMVVT
jgi:MFS family permease